MELEPNARRILELAQQARTPTTSDKARVEERLAVALAATTAATVATASGANAASGGAGAAATGGGLALKGGLVAALIAAGGSLGYLAQRGAPTVHETQAPRAPAAALQPQAAPPEASPAIESEPPIEAARELEPQRAETPVRRPRSGASSEPALDARELDLLHRAQAAWRARDASSALALASEHRQRFPRSPLQLERDGLRALALCELGRRDEALPIARGLLERHPYSPLRTTLEENCRLK